MPQQDATAFFIGSRKEISFSESDTYAKLPNLITVIRNWRIKIVGIISQVNGIPAMDIEIRIDIYAKADNTCYIALVGSIIIVVERVG